MTLWYATFFVNPTQFNNAKDWLYTPHLQKDRVVLEESWFPALCPLS